MAMTALQYLPPSMLDDLPVIFARRLLSTNDVAFASILAEAPQKLDTKGFVVIVATLVSSNSLLIGCPSTCKSWPFWTRMKRTITRNTKMITRNKKAKRLT